MKVYTLILMFSCVCVYVTAEKEVPVPSSYSSEGTRCDKDLDVAGTCLRCSRLPEEIAVQLTTCCMEDKAYDACERCVDNPDGCLVDAYSRTGSDSDVVDDTEYPGLSMSKRYGTMFLGSSRYGYPRKRYGRLFTGGRNRGSYRGYRYGGRGKRYDTSNLKQEDLSDEESVDKRFGSFSLGRARGLKYRYGRYGKRADDSEEEGIDETSDNGHVNKRYGTLFTWRNGGRKLYHGSLFKG